MNNQIKPLRNQYTADHITKALNITRSIWCNITSGRTAPTAKQRAAIKRAINTRFDIIDTVTGLSCTVEPFESFMQAVAAIESESPRYQIKTIYK